MRRLIVAVCGDAGVYATEDKMELAERLGKALVDNGYRVMTGGLGGVMEAAAKGARSSEKYLEGDTIGILPGRDPGDANDFIDISIPTGMDHGRNAIIASADAMVAIGGGAGTLNEISIAWMLKRLIISYLVDGWSGKLAGTRLDNRIRNPEVAEDQVFPASNEKDVIDLLERYLKSYNARYHGIKRRI